MNIELLEKTEHLLKRGWVWKDIEGLGRVLSCPDNETYPLKQIAKNILIPEFLKIELTSDIT
jgi:hypothetical protein